MLRWWAIYLLTGLITIGVHGHLSRATESGPDLVKPMLLHFGVAFLVYLVALRAARRLRAAPAVPVVLWCFVVAALSHFAYLSSSVLLSPEVNRYRWDGMVAEAGYNPYRVAPDDPELAPLRAEFPDEIEDPGRKGLYPPLAELFFYGMARLGTDSVFHYRAFLSLMSLLCGLALLPLCRGAGVPLSRVTVFLWHPLLVLETAANAHLETLGIFFLLLSLSLLITGHQLSPMGFIGLSTLVKPYPLALLPLYFRRVPLYRVLPYFLVVLVGSVPFLGAGRDLLSGALEFASLARFNPGPYILAEELFTVLGRPEWTRAAIGMLGLVMAGVLYLTDDGSSASILRRAFYLALPPLLLGPVIKPWYVVWLIPFLALVSPGNPMRFAILYLSGSVGLGYLQLLWGQLPAWVSWVEFGPVALLGIGGAWTWFRSAPKAAPDTSGPS
jgi:hypothetical protein